MISDINEYDLDEVEELDRPVPKPRRLNPIVPPLPQPQPRARASPLQSGSSERATPTSPNKSNILRSLGSVSKQISSDVTAKMSSSVKTANDKLEKGLSEGTRFAKGTIKKTINTTREIRDNITKSAIDNTPKIRIKPNENTSDMLRTTSMPAVSMNLFKNINFYSPLQEAKQEKYKNWVANRELERRRQHRNIDREDLSFEIREHNQAIPFGSNNISNAHDMVANRELERRWQNFNIDREDLSFEFMEYNEAIPLGSNNIRHDHDMVANRELERRNHHRDIDRADLSIEIREYDQAIPSNSSNNRHDQYGQAIPSGLSNSRHDQYGQAIPSGSSNNRHDQYGQAIPSGSSNNRHDQYGQAIPSGSSNNRHDQFIYDTPNSSRTNSIIERAVTPEEDQSWEPVEASRVYSNEEIEPYNMNVQIKKDVSYENWSLPFDTKPATKKEETPEEIAVSKRPSKSTIIEFDPLKESKSEKKFEGVSNELLLLHAFLANNKHSTTDANDGQDVQEDVFYLAESEYYNPPTPPERSDSLADDDDKQSEAGAFSRDSNSNWYVPQRTPRIEITEIGLREDLKPTDTVMRKFSRKLRLDSVLSKSTKVKVETIEKPPVNHLPVTHYSGMLSKVVTPGRVEDIFRNSQSRYCMLSDQQLICYSDPTSGQIKESYLLENVLALQIVLPVSSSLNDSYCFELWVSCGVGKTLRKVVFTCGSVSERRNWAQKIAEHLTGAFLPKYTAEFTRMGWCYLKEGVTGEWRGAWLMLTRRVLLYTDSDSSLMIIDLRKTKCVVLQDADEDAKNMCPSDSSSNLLLDCPLLTIYLRFPYERLLKDWLYMLRLAAHNNGAYIHHQQLTNDDVPVLVSKCLSFIYAHGSVSEGIYRRAGSTGTLSELLSRFRRDAWSVQLSIGEHSEHDVAGVLKRFLRDLPETLLPANLHNALFAAIEIRDESSRFAEYRRLMCSLPLVARNTARKLFAHLHFLHTLSHVNKMNAENLASVWAPTIMPPAMTSNVVQTAWSNKEVFIVRDLILHYESIWKPTDSEKKTETAVRQVLMRVLSNSAPSAPKAAGDLKVWIYIKDRSTCHQVALSPSKTAEDVCVELCDKAKMESHLLMLEEVVCAESMRRIVHIDEIVLDVVLRWGYWDEEDRKDSYLVLKENSILHEMEALRHNNSLVCGELKLATDSSKAFKPHMFEFQNGCLCYFKDKQGSHKIEEWNIKNIFWYVGHEPKRNPQSRWAITFIPRNKQKRTKEKPWFGCTIAGAVTEDRLKWMAAMMFGEHSNILPTPRLVIT